MFLCLWDFPGNSTAVGCHFLLEGIFPTQGLDLCLLRGRWNFYHWATEEALINAVFLPKHWTWIYLCRFYLCRNYYTFPDCGLSYMITFKKISDYNFMKVRGSMCGEVGERENYSRLKDTKKTWYINTHTHTHTHIWIFYWCIPFLA